MMKSLFLISLAVILLSACAPHIGNNPVDASARQIQNQTIENRWWLTFNDPLLNELVSKIEIQNLDIQIAEARLREARALRSAAQSRLLPEISAAGAASRSNMRSNNAENFLQAGFDAAWEIDLFGRLSAGVDAAAAREIARTADIAEVRNIIVADLTRALIEWRQARQTQAEIKSLLKSQQEQISLLRERSNAGLIDASFLERARAQKAQTETALPQAEAAALAAQYQIERLLADRSGLTENLLKKEETAALRIPKLEALDQITVDRLRDRPDIRLARANLLEAQANLREAEANLWPRLSLSSFLGLQDGGDGLRLASNPAWSLASGLSAPILNFGRLRAERKASDERRQQVLLSYEDTVNRALQETKTAMSDYMNGIQAVSDRNKALKSRKDTVYIARERFERGLTDMTDLTTAQAELDQATIDLINQKTSTAIAFIRLQKALSL
ncbi:MAG: efflux transporter outer membrane subunit [Alphaproteobacteria bacterium]